MHHVGCCKAGLHTGVGLSNAPPSSCPLTSPYPVSCAGCVGRSCVLQLYERFSARFNIVHVACALTCLADKTAVRLAHKQPQRAELAALRAFVGQLLETASAQMPSIDPATAAALLHSLARLATTGQVSRAAVNGRVGQAGQGALGSSGCQLWGAFSLPCVGCCVYSAG